MYGGKVLQWLVERGWSPAPFGRKRGEAMICGDRQVVDPLTKKNTNVYEAAKIQKDRTGEYPDFLSQ